ncbi:MAG: hypothetical protein P8X63_10675 [Desulfuromonadaceae bacterium]
MPFRWKVLLFTTIFLCGCSSSSLLPSNRETVRSPWPDYAAAKRAYDQIKPYQTTYDEIKHLGFDPYTTPNIEVLNYLDVMRRFMPNQGIKKEDLDLGIQQCLEAKTECRAFEIIVENTQNDRYGNPVLDIFNFRRKTKTSGWGFKALVVMNNNLAIYKLWSGKPNIDYTNDKKNPLGPLQSSEDTLKKSISPW